MINLKVCSLQLTLTRYHGYRWSSKHGKTVVWKRGSSTFLEYFLLCCLKLAAIKCDCLFWEWVHKGLWECWVRSRWALCPTFFPFLLFWKPFRIVGVPEKRQFQSSAGISFLNCNAVKIVTVKGFCSTK